MKATELMINDWVYNSKHEKCKVYGISNIFDSNITLDNYDRENDGCFEIEFEVDPIPISKEILVKNGFEHTINELTQEQWFTLIHEGTRFTLKYARSVFQWLNPLDFKYVHELQHVLRLCDIKKEIIL